MEHIFMVLLHWRCVSIKSSQVAEKLIVFSTFGQANGKENFKAMHYVFFVREIHRSSGRSEQCACSVGWLSKSRCRHIGLSYKKSEL